MTRNIRDTVWICNKKGSYQNHLHNPNVGLEKHEELFQMLTELDIGGEDLRILRNIYWERTAAVRIDNELSEFKPSRRGVCHGWVLSPNFFSLYREIE